MRLIDRMNGVDHLCRDIDDRLDEMNRPQLKPSLAQLRVTAERLFASPDAAMAKFPAILATADRALAIPDVAAVCYGAVVSDAKFFDQFEAWLADDDDGDDLRDVELLIALSRSIETENTDLALGVALLMLMARMRLDDFRETVHRARSEGGVPVLVAMVSGSTGTVDCSWLPGPPSAALGPLTH
jgi:hypothetical protein